MSKSSNIDQIIKRILRSLAVELGDEFDRNFERQAFFSQAWARRKSPGREGRALLIDSGSLRGSITSRSDDHSITFCTDKPYAGIHNTGGEIRVTARMKRYFWARYYQTSGSFGRKKDGSMRQDKRNSRLSTEADFWRLMALMKVGSAIRIPRRQFLGTSPEVEKLIREVIEENISEYFKIDFTTK